MTKRTSTRRARFVAIAWLLLAPMVAGAQEASGPTLITQFEAQDPAAQQLAAVVAEALELNLRLAGIARATRADFLMPDYAFAETERYFRRVDAERAVFGAIERSAAGGYVVHGSVWSGEDGAVTKLRSEIDSVFAVFDLADDLALEIAEAVVGRDLAFGRLEIANTEHLGAFAVYIDGQLVARNESQTRVLAGERTVTVTRRGPLGDQPVARFEVDVLPDAVATVSLAAPARAADPPAETSQPAERDETEPSGAPRETGALVVESTPPGATVRLDGTEIGTTPLEMFGVETGRYELELHKPLFRRAVAAVDVQSNRSTELSEPLQVDAGHPEVAARLIRPAAPSIAGLVSAGIKGAYLGWTFGSGNAWHYNSFRAAAPLLSVLDLAAISAIHAGTLVANDAPASMIVSLSNAALLAGPAVAASLSSELLGYDLSGQPWYSTLAAGVAIGGSLAFALYDIAFNPSAAQRTNAALLSEVQASGSVPAPPDVSRRRVLVDIGAGALGRISYVQELFHGYGRAELGLGASLAPGDSLPALPVGTLRIAARPFAGSVPGAQPELSAILQGDSDFDTYGVAIGAAIGTVWSFRRFEVLWRSNYLFGLRTKKQQFSSSVGVSL